MNVRGLGLPFRVGATSYIVPADLLTNALFLAPSVQDMQLVLFDVPGGPSNLPGAAEVEALAAAGRAHDLTYTVHLMDDLAADQPAALARARLVVERTRPLAPWAWVGHLEGRAVRAEPDDAPARRQWQARMAAALPQALPQPADLARLAVENLEGYPPAFVAPVVAQTAAGRCVDVGHLWLDGHDPLPQLQAALPRLRVVHLHGVAARDHASLVHAPVAQLDAVVRFLLSAPFTGVLTLEIFGAEDFWSSLDALAASIERVR